jgi:tRNA threonylcarbamoyladenosine biosynthesis protein TsaB
VRAAFIDAGRGEVYRGLYGADLEPLCGETAGSLTGWIETLPESGIEIVTAEAGRFAAELEGSRCAGTRVVEAPRFLGATIARIGLGEYLAGRSVDPASVDANYVRRADAELNWKALLRTAGP